MQYPRIYCVVFCMALCSLNTWAQEKIRVFVGDIEGQDAVLCKQCKMLFIKELGRLKCVTLVESKEQSQYQLSGNERLKNRNTTFTYKPGSQFTARLTVKLFDSAQNVVFVYETGATKNWPDEAAQTMVTDILKDMKKQMKWK